jgi:hypothetical protein
VNHRSQQLCIWSGPVGFTLFGIGFWPLAHFLPPPSPALSASEIAAIYAHNTLGIRLGCILVMLAASLFIPFFAVISVFMKRIEGTTAPYAYTQAIAAALVIACFFLGPMVMSMAAFRPERAPELTQMLNDIAWFLTASPGALATVQTIVIGLAVLADNRITPIFPRWAGYMSLWVAVLYLPAGLCVMFKTGPFAWDGILAFWIPAVLVGSWANVFAMLMAKSLKQQPAS